MALLAAPCLFVLTPEGVPTWRLRPLVAQPLGLPDADSTPRHLGYDLRRLARKRLIARVDRELCCMLTPKGRRAARFLTTRYARIFRPGFQALDARITSQAPPPLRAALAAVDQATDAFLREARLAA